MKTTIDAAVSLVSQNLGNFKEIPKKEHIVIKSTFQENLERLRKKKNLGN